MNEPRGYTYPDHLIGVQEYAVFSPKWDARFLLMAEMVASWSKDPSTQCGSVLVRPDRTVASVGFNGGPRGTDDSPTILGNRHRKLLRTIHAEANALRMCKEDMWGYRLYVWQPCNIGPSCANCAAEAVQAKIGSVVFAPEESSFDDRWRDSYLEGMELYRETGTAVIRYKRKHLLDLSQTE
jgi:dCMP deaminase